MGVGGRGPNGWCLPCFSRGATSARRATCKNLEIRRLPSRVAAPKSLFPFFSSLRTEVLFKTPFDVRSRIFPSSPPPLPSPLHPLAVTSPVSVGDCTTQARVLNPRASHAKTRLAFFSLHPPKNNTLIPRVDACQPPPRPRPPNSCLRAPQTLSRHPPAPRRAYLLQTPRQWPRPPALRRCRPTLRAESSTRRRPTPSRPRPPSRRRRRTRTLTPSSTTSSPTMATAT